MALRQYAAAHDGYLPPLSLRDGALVFPPDALYPEHIDSLSWFRIPDFSLKGLYKCMRSDHKEGSSLRAQDSDYFYSGYALRDEEAGRLFALWYRERARTGGDFEADIVLDGRVLSRLRIRQLASSEHTTRSDLATAIEESRTPVLIQRPRGRDREWTVQNLVVLYLDGHIEWRKYPGTFPTSREFIGQLLDAERHLDEVGPRSDLGVTDAVRPRHARRPAMAARTHARKSNRPPIDTDEHSFGDKGRQGPAHPAPARHQRAHAALASVCIGGCRFLFRT